MSFRQADVRRAEIGGALDCAASEASANLERIEFLDALLIALNCVGADMHGHGRTGLNGCRCSQPRSPRVAHSGHGSRLGAGGRGSSGSKLSGEGRKGFCLAYGWLSSFGLGHFVRAAALPSSRRRSFPNPTCEPLMRVGFPKLFRQSVHMRPQTIVHRAQCRRSVCQL